MQVCVCVHKLLTDWGVGITKWSKRFVCQAIRKAKETKTINQII